MNFFKKYPAFCTTLIVLLLLFITGVVFIIMSASRSGASMGKLKRAENNLRAALSLSPAPTQANLEASEANIAQLKEVFNAQIEATQGRSPEIFSQKPPLSGTDMYYDLLAYKNELDRVASAVTPYNDSQSGVTVPQGFNWGFSRYLAAGEGEPPPQSAIPTVFRQKQVLNYLLRKLLATGPQSIVSVKREPVVLDKPGELKKGAKKDKEDALKDDEFWVGVESVAVKDAVETLGFQIGFTGYTPNLRQFLKDISSFELPLVVRGVEVKPFGDDGNMTQSSTNASGQDDLFAIFGGSTAETGEDQVTAIEDNQEPVVEQNISEFTIVVEFIEVTSGKEETES